jgi:acetyl-CoA synthase
MYISSSKFISGEGGHQRIVWMSKQLKEEVAERLKAALEKEGCPELFDKIATEENAEEPEKLVEYLTQVSHPALAMPALLG